MSLRKRYSGEFASRDDLKWRCEIWQESATAYTVGELTFGATPLVVEWHETSKDEVIRSSSATLVIESPGDRTYADLYTIAPGLVRLDVYRSGSLWWSGTLDPEFYEEPFTRNAHYDVTLTFSDFGILKRLDFDLTGSDYVSNIVRAAVSRSRIKVTSTSLVSIVTSKKANTSTSVTTGLYVNALNFFDEEGEASSWWDVLEGILRPLGMHMIQSCGRVRLFDLNGLARQGASARTQITWASDDQVMSADKVASKITVTLSVYGTEDRQTAAEYCDGATTAINMSTSKQGEQSYDYYTFAPNISSPSGDYSFNMHHSETGGGLAYINSEARYFKIRRLFGGQDCEGVAWSYVVGKYAMSATGWARKLSSSVPAPTLGDVVLTSNIFAVGGMSLADQSKYLLRIKLEVMFDPRYNPFEDKENNEDFNYRDALNNCRELAIPVSVELLGSSGAVTHHWTNTGMTSLSSGTMRTLGNTCGVWVSGAAPSGTDTPDAWLRYYDGSVRGHISAVDGGKGGMLGWRTNRQALGGWPGPVSSALTNLEDGQYIPYPPSGGSIRIKVHPGIQIIQYTLFREEEFEDSARICEACRWALYKAPHIDIVNNDSIMSALDSDDIVYTGLLAQGAAEELSIDTVCGTAGAPAPGCLGIYLDSTGAQVTGITRQGRTGTVEDLLIGTLYNQYAARHIKLTGTTSNRPNLLDIYTEQCIEGKVFMLTGAVCDIAANETKGTYVEVTQD